MATSGSIDSGGYEGRVLQFNWDTQSTSGNTRTIKYSITAVGGSVNFYYHHNDYVNINGVRVYTGGDNVKVWRNTVLAQGSMIINQSDTSTLTVDMHGGIYSRTDNINTSDSWNLDSIITAPTIYSVVPINATETSITFRFSCSQANSWFYKLSTDDGYHDGPTNNVTEGEFTISGLSDDTTYTINFIARNWIEPPYRYLDDYKEIQAATFNYPKPIEMNDFTIGDGALVNLYNPLHRQCTLEIFNLNNNLLLGTFSGTYTGEVNLEFKTPEAIDLQYRSLTDAKKARYYAKATYDGHIKTLGTGGYVKYYSVKDNGTENPTFIDFTFEDSNPDTILLTGNNSKIINKYSSIKANITSENKATGNYYATMSGYKMTNGNKMYPLEGVEPWSDTETVSLEIDNIDNSTIIVSAIDTRGLSTSVTKIVPVEDYIEYEDIVIATIEANRVSGGVSSETSINYSGMIWNNSFGAYNNEITSIEYYYKITGQDDSSYILGGTVLNPVLTGNTFSQEVLIQGDLAGEGFTISNSYTIKLVVNDRLSSYEKTTILQVGIPIIAFHKNGIAVGRKYNVEEGGILQLSETLYTDEIGTVNAIELAQNCNNFKRLLLRGYCIPDLLNLSIPNVYFEKTIYPGKDCMIYEPIRQRFYIYIHLYANSKCNRNNFC